MNKHLKRLALNIVFLVIMTSAVYGVVMAIETAPFVALGGLVYMFIGSAIITYFQEKDDE